jgi:hypothetical protein
MSYCFKATHCGYFPLKQAYLRFQKSKDSVTYSLETVQNLRSCHLSSYWIATIHIKLTHHHHHQQQQHHHHHHHPLPPLPNMCQPMRSVTVSNHLFVGRPVDLLPEARFAEFVWIALPQRTELQALQSGLHKYFAAHCNYIGCTCGGAIFCSQNYLAANQSNELTIYTYVERETAVAVPWLRQSVTGLSRRRPGIDSSPAYEGLVVYKVALGRVSSQGTTVFPSVSFHQCSITHTSLNYHWRCIILVNDSIVKLNKI